MAKLETEILNNIFINMRGIDMVNLETETLKKLIKRHVAADAVGIYNKFVYDYKEKHLGEIIVHTDPEASANWYKRRGEVFARYVQRYYL
jgi:hypothetical protein